MENIERIEWECMFDGSKGRLEESCVEGGVAYLSAPCGTTLSLEAAERIYETLGKHIERAKRPQPQPGEVWEDHNGRRWHIEEEPVDGMVAVSLLEKPSGHLHIRGQVDQLARRLGRIVYDEPEEAPEEPWVVVDEAGCYWFLRSEVGNLVCSRNVELMSKERAERVASGLVAFRQTARPATPDEIAAANN